MRRPLLTRSQLPIKARIFQISIRVADMDRSDIFYTQALGMARRGKFSAGGGVEDRFYGYDSDPTETMITLITFGQPPARETDVPLQAPVSFNLTVPDVFGVVDKVVAAGGSVVRAPITRELGEFIQDMAFVADPDGTVMELTSFR